MSPRLSGVEACRPKQEYRAVRFDARAAKLVKPGQHLVVGGCPGLRLEATPSTKTWTYRYKSPIDGRMKQAALGQWPHMGIIEAAQAWQEKRQQRGERVEPGKPKKAAPARLYSVADLVADYLAGHIEQGRREAGAVAARRRLQSAIEPVAPRPAASITRSDAFDLLEAHKGAPTAAAAKLRGLLGGAWDYALDAGRLDGNAPNWWRVVHRGRLKSRGKIVGGEHQGQSRRVLHADEVKALLAWLPNMHQLGRDCAVMYLWTSTRGVEFLGMRAEHVRKESDGWWWTCPKAATKNARHADAVDLRVPLVGIKESSPICCATVASRRRRSWTNWPHDCRPQPCVAALWPICAASSPVPRLAPSCRNADPASLPNASRSSKPLTSVLCMRPRSGGMRPSAPRPHTRPGSLPNAKGSASCAMT